VPTYKGRRGDKKRREGEGKDGRGKRGREMGGKGKGRVVVFLLVHVNLHLLKQIVTYSNH